MARGALEAKHEQGYIKVKGRQEDMTQEELRAIAKQSKREATRGLNSLLKIPEGYASAFIADIVDFIVSASVAETLAEIKKDGKTWQEVKFRR